MCGIFCYVAKEPNFFKVKYKKIYDNFEEIRPRGPDSSMDIIIQNIFMGFHRLRVNDLSENADQPMIRSDKYYLICNGEIFNHKYLKETYQLNTKSSSDCEVILALYEKFLKEYNMDVEKAITYTISLLDGEFAGVLHDAVNDSLFVFRDRYGVRPLFVGLIDEDIMFASELKGINSLAKYAYQFMPGRVCMIQDSEVVFYSSYREDNNPIIRYSNMTDISFYTQNIYTLFENAVKKRLMSERPVCALLSGGLDSSLVASFAAKHLPYKLHTFSIGMPGSTDLDFATKVAEYIQSEHTNITLEKDTFLNAIEDTIRVIESYDITTVRASVGNYLISKYIRENTPFKIVLNGDYSDEVTGGYIYLRHAPNQLEFDEECKSLVNNICFFDSLRSDRTISSQGLEARVPFADTDFVEFYQTIPPNLRYPQKIIEKHLLRSAFEGKNVLPQDVLWRRKEAFSDGISSNSDSWHTIIKQYIDTKVTDDEFKECGMISKEAYFYKKIYRKYYDHENVIPKYWMPKWVDNKNDPSAREIPTYSFTSDDQSGLSF